MVSLRKKFGVSFFISALVLVCLLMPAELKASQPCCLNGKLSDCPDLPNGQQYDISNCTSVGVGGTDELTPTIPDKPGLGGGNIDVEKPTDPITQCTSGQTQNKYTASGCGYSTSTRTCCSDGRWSAWGGSCQSCSSSQCWDGTKCVDKEVVSRLCSGNITNAQSGMQTRTATCTNGTGWSYGSWSGFCTCKTGYTWSGSSCSRKDPSITLYNCQIVPNKEGNAIWIGAKADSAPASFRVPVVFTLLCGDENGRNAATVQGTYDLEFSTGTLSTSKELNVNNQCYPPKNVQGCVLSNKNIYWL